MQVCYAVVDRNGERWVIVLYQAMADAVAYRCNERDPSCAARRPFTVQQTIEE